MGTIESKLSYLLRTKEEIRNAIQGKGVNVTNDDTFRSYADKIRAIVGTEYYVPSLAPNGVNFKDYDGGVLHTYTKDEFLALTEMPALPSRPRLVCQGWNWNLEDAKAYVEANGFLDVGATYITDDGKTRFYIKLDGRNDCYFSFSINNTNSLTIDWGDGKNEVVSGSGKLNVSHLYETIGEYVISLDVADGATLSFGTTAPYDSLPVFARPYSNMVKKIELGERIQIDRTAFSYFYSLSSVTIPNSVTTISGDAFSYCHSLSSIVIPNSVTNIGDNGFRYCFSLLSIVIPNSVTSIGTYFLQSAYRISSIVISNEPSTLPNYYLAGCYATQSVIIPNGIEAIGNYSFQHNYTLPSVTIPNSVTTIGGYAFSECKSLSSVTMYNGITRIGDYAFSNCVSLPSVVIPNSVNSIGNYVFNACNCLELIDFRSHTSVPTLSGYNSFSGVASDCKIVVPDELYDSWIAATNWSNSNVAKYIVKASEFNG